MNKPAGLFSRIALLYFSVVLLAFSACDTQHDPNYWAKTFNYSDGIESAYAMKPSTDGGYILSGTVSINRGTQMDMGDIWAAKLNSEGNVEWQKVYSGPGVEIGIDGMDILLAGDGGYIISCRSRSFDTVYSPWIIKLNSSGAIQWQKNYSDGKYSTAKSMTAAPDGGYVLLIGASNELTDPGTGENTTVANEAELMKIDTAGNIQWLKGYSYSDGTVFQDIESVDAAPDGGYIITGAVAPSEPEGTNNIYRDALIIKTDSEGNLLWKSEISGFRVFNSINSVKAVSDGYIGVGSTSVPESIGNRDFFMVKFDLDGNILWQKKFDVNNSDQDEFASLELDNDGNCIAAGSTDGYDAGDIAVTLFNTEGGILWTKIYDAERCDAMEIHQTARGYAVAGYNGLGLLISFDDNGDIPYAENRIRSISPTLHNTDFSILDRPISDSTSSRTVTETSAILKNLSLTVEDL